MLLIGKLDKEGCKDSNKKLPITHPPRDNHCLPFRMFSSLYNLKTKAVFESFNFYAICLNVFHKWGK